MTREEAINHIKDILAEATETEDAVCYVTNGDAEALEMAIEALEFYDKYEQLWEEIKTAGKQGKEVEIRHGGRLFKIREVDR